MHQYLVSPPRNDKYLRKIAHENRNLKDRYHEKDLHFINYLNAITLRHLNTSKVHFNKRDKQVISNQFAKATSNIINLQSVLHSLTNNDSIMTMF